MSLASGRVRQAVIFVIPLLFLIWMQWIKLQSPVRYRDINLENHIIQNLQVLVLAVAAVLLFVAARRLSAQPRYIRWAIVLAGCALVFVVGEEIQWGQYIFHLQPSGFFASNTEGELNLHNMPTEQHLLDYVFMLVGVLGAIAWLVPIRAGRVVLAAVAGIFGSWLLRDHLASLVLAGKTFSGRSWDVQLAIIIMGAVLVAVPVAILLAWIGSIGGGKIRNLPVPAWYLSLYFLPLAVYAFLWKVLNLPAFLGGSFNAWQPLLNKYLVWSDQEPAELLFYSALLMMALWVYQLAIQEPQNAGT